MQFGPCFCFEGVGVLLVLDSSQGPFPHEILSYFGRVEGHKSIVHLSTFELIIENRAIVKVIR